jgi:diguanylate cyclase (GGDEF)-like protein
MDRPPDDAAPQRPVAHALWRAAHDLAFDFGPDGVVRDASPSAHAWFGTRHPRLLDLVHHRDAGRLLRLIAGETTPPMELHFRELAPRAGWRTLEIVAATPHAGTTVAVARDVTVERRASATLDAHRQVLELVARAEPLPAVLDALARSIEAASGGALVVVLAARGDDLELVAAPRLRADAASAFSRVTGAAVADVFPTAGALSGALAAAATEHGLGFGWAAPVVERDGEVPRAVLLLFPGAKRFPTAAEQEALAASLPLARVALIANETRAAARTSANTDPLTGVLTRAAFLAEVERLGRRGRDTMGMLVVAVDDLAGINERNGNDAGDAALRAVAERLAHVVRGRDVVGRVSGNRFAVACGAATDAEALEKFAARVRTAMDAPLVHPTGAIPLDVRVALEAHRGRVTNAAAVVAQAERAVRPAAGAPDGEKPDESLATTDGSRADRARRRSGSRRDDR